MNNWFQIGGALIDLKPLDCVPKMFGFVGLVILMFLVLVVIRIFT